MTCFFQYLRVLLPLRFLYNGKQTGCTLSEEGSFIFLKRLPKGCGGKQYGAHYQCLQEAGAVFCEEDHQPNLASFTRKNNAK